MVFCCKSKVVPDDHAAVKYDKVKRKCRDILCTLIFIVFCLGMIIVAAVGVQNGDPLRLVYATDYKGSTCGDGKLGSIAYFPRMNQDLLDASREGTAPLDTKFYTICVEKCPAVGELVCNYDGDSLSVLLRCCRLQQSLEYLPQIDQTHGQTSHGSRSVGRCLWIQWSY